MAIQKILIVDDSPTERYFLSDILIKHGFSVSTAENGEEALLKVKAARGIKSVVLKADTPSGYWVADDFPLSEVDLERAMTDEVEPRLAAGRARLHREARGPAGTAGKNRGAGLGHGPHRVVSGNIGSPGPRAAGLP